MDRRLEDYGHILFIAPLWNGRIASPLKSLLVKERDAIRTYSFATFCGGYEKTDQLKKVKEELRALIGNDPKSLFELDVSDLFPAEKRKQIREVTPYHVRPQDLARYEAQIAQIEKSVRV